MTDSILHILNFRNLWGSGLTESVPALCDAQAKTLSSVVLAVNRARDDWRAAHYRLLEVPCWKPLQYVGLSNRFRKAVQCEASNAQIVHVHDLWTMVSLYGIQAAKKTDCRLVVSPRGTLSTAALSIGGHKKRAMWRLVQQRNLNRADCLHATSLGEYRDIREAGVLSPVSIVPNGVNVPKVPLETSPQVDDTQPMRTMLYFGRIHPIKGLENLILAWRRIQFDFPNWRLRIVGLDDGGHLSKLKEVATSISANSISFEPPVFGASKFDLFRQSNAYILPSFSENFGMTVAESLASGCPVIVTTGAPWAQIAQVGCGWTVDPNPDSIESCLRKVLAFSAEELAIFGARGKAWMETDFTWSAIALKMIATYDWLQGAPKPDFVLLD